MRHLVSQFYKAEEQREAVKQYFIKAIEDKIIRSVKSGEPTESHGEAYKMINSIFSSMKKEFGLKGQTKANMNQNK